MSLCIRSGFAITFFRAINSLGGGGVSECLPAGNKTHYFSICLICAVEITVKFTHTVVCKIHSY